MRAVRIARSAVDVARGRGLAVTLSPTDPDSAPLPAASWCAILDHLARAGRRHFLFAGGEPQDHPELATILTHARAIGPVLVVTARAPGPALRGVDTVAIAIEPARTLPPALGEALAWRRDETVEALVVAEPGSARWLPGTVRAAAAAGALVFLSPDHPSSWGRRDDGGDPRDVASLARALTAIASEPALQARGPFLEDLLRAHRGCPLPCHAGPARLAVDARGRPRPCRRAAAAPTPIVDLAPDDLAATLAPLRPVRCLCAYDDYADARAARLTALFRAARRSLASLRQESAPRSAGRGPRAG